MNKKIRRERWVFLFFFQRKIKNIGPFPKASRSHAMKYSFRTDSEVVPMNRHEAIWEKVNHFFIGIYSKRSVCEKQNSQTTSF